jgi:hypothetical protein
MLTPRSRVIFEKLTGSQLMKKFSTFYETRRLIPTFTSARHLSLSWTISIQYMPPSYFLKIHLNIILPSTTGLNGIYVIKVKHCHSISKRYYSSYFLTLFAVIQTYRRDVNSLRKASIGLIQNRYRNEFETLAEKYRRDCLLFSCLTCHQAGVQNSCNA